MGSADPRLCAPALRRVCRFEDRGRRQRRLRGKNTLPTKVKRATKGTFSGGGKFFLCPSFTRRCQWLRGTPAGVGKTSAPWRAPKILGPVKPANSGIKAGAGRGRPLQTRRDSRPGERASRRARPGKVGKLLGLAFELYVKNRPCPAGREKMESAPSVQAPGGSSRPWGRASYQPVTAPTFLPG